ncbi:hypothetical protein [Salinivibrio kushneri]|uniref:Uncharacterized protein n=1 Tax=Salinivibrio kushneri TaxID=1908198 RepID=A0AB36K7B1_9GAMM|nr:hypothetical protein [Salinivibrio kushneri]OOE45104.1 hypothetical protein BZG09_05205 [Salinivibrio kushneri]
MQYYAIQLSGDGGVVRHPETEEPKAIEVGDLDDMQAAIDQACQQLECRHIFKGVITRGNGLGGYLVADAHELAEMGVQ